MKIFSNSRGENNYKKIFETTTPYLTIPFTNHPNGPLGISILHGISRPWIGADVHRGVACRNVLEVGHHVLPRGNTISPEVPKPEKASSFVWLLSNNSQVLCKSLGKWEKYNKRSAEFFTHRISSITLSKVIRVSATQNSQATLKLTQSGSISQIGFPPLGGFLGCKSAS